MINLVRTARQTAVCAAAIFGVWSAAWGAVVGPEVAVTPTFGPAVGTQDNVAVAAGPNGYFAVWQDNRSDGDVDIFGCRISASGQVLDPMSIPICTIRGNQLTPAVAWDGQRYMVAWADRRDPAQHIYCCRVSSAGEVLDPQGILVSGTAGSQSSPRVAGDGTGSLIVWQDTRGQSPDIYCCKVTCDGSPSKTYGISTRADNEEAPDVAYNGSVYLVVWQDYRNVASTDTEIYGIRVSRTGVRTGMETLISCTTAGTVGATGAQRYPRVCAVGSSWIAVWEDLRVDGKTSDIYGSRISSTGVVQDNGGIGICKATGDQQSPAVGYNASKVLVTWRNGSDRKIRGARLATSGGLLDTNGIALSSGAAGSSGCAVTGAKSSFIVCWSTLSATASDCVFTPVSDAGLAQNTAGIVASVGLDSQQDYAVVDNGTDYAVVWSQIVNGSRDILAAKVSRAGVLLTQTPVNLTSGFNGEQTQPAIAWNGSKYLVVWRGSEAYSTSDLDIRGRFLDANLSPIGTTAINVCTASEEQCKPAVASNKNNFLVVWQDSRNAASPNYFNDLFGAIVVSTSAVTPMSAALCLATNNQYSPRVASDGSGYMVVWEDYRTGTPAIRGARVSSVGSLLDTSGIILPATSTSQTTPNVCYGNGSYFVMWSDYSRITGCRVTSSGTILDAKGIIINTGTKRKQWPSACWDGQKYQVVWEDYRSADYANGDIYATTVSSTGVVAGYPEIAMASSLVPQERPCVFAAGGFGVLFFSSYCNYSDSIRYVTLEDGTIQEVGNVAQAKLLPAGTLIALSGKVVSAVYPGFFYIQEQDRSSGIRVVSGISTAVGNLVDVVGTVSVVDGERQISAGEAMAMGVADDNALRPLCIRGDWLGGGPLNNQTPGVTGGVGLNNIGLLVTTWGNVVSTSSKYFYIQIKPALTVKVISNSLQQPAVGKTVIITGISTCEIVAGASCRAIMPRNQDDIRVLQ